MMRLVFWLITIGVILAAWWSIPRESENIPREYITSVPPNDLNSSTTIDLVFAQIRLQFIRV